MTNQDRSSHPFMRFSARSPFALVATLATLMAFGLASEAFGDGGRRQGPPPEAFEACVDAVEEDGCVVVNRRGDEMSGQCLVRREALVCVPDDHPRHARCRDGEGGEQASDFAS